MTDNDNVDLQPGEARREAAFLVTGDILKGRGKVDHLNFFPATDTVEVNFTNGKTVTFHQSEKIVVTEADPLDSQIHIV